MSSWVRLKMRLLSYASPVRWSYLGFLFAVSLFFVELGFSCYDIYLSLVGGIVVSVRHLAEIMIAVSAVSIAGGGVLFVVFVLLSLFWFKNKATDDVYQAVLRLERTLENVSRGLAQHTQNASEDNEREDKL
jgi:hypothetical protein